MREHETMVEQSADGGVVDVDALLARIRARIAQDRPSVEAPTGQRVEAGRRLEPDEPGQAELNRALARAIRLLAMDRQQTEGKLGLIEEWLREETERAAYLAARGAQRTGELDDRLTVLERLTDRVAALETLGERVGALEALSERVAALGDAVEELGVRLAAVGGRLIDFEVTLGRELDGLRGWLTGELAAAEARLRDEQPGGEALDALGRRLEETVAAAEARLRARSEQDAAALREAAGAVGALSETVDGLRGRVEAVAGAAGPEGAVGRALDELRMRVLRAERRARVVAEALAPERPASAAPASEVGGGARPAEQPTGPGVPAPSLDYFMFEHRFRGSVAEIKRRQTIYLDLFRGRQRVLDVGCGRGEFLELLAEHGVAASGVDLNEDMVEFCRDRGLSVARADGLEHLAGLPDASLDGIFAAQLVEHLTPDQLLRLGALCAAKLAPGGVAVIETINSDCPEAMSWFYLDPTHVRPVPARLLAFVLEQSGLDGCSLRFSSPLPDRALEPVMDVVSEYPAAVALYQDYAAVAHKR